MTSKNFTIDNVNPLIQYAPAGAWTEGSKTTDSLASSYSNGGTFTLCTTQGSSATFTFNGTQVYVFGAKRGKPWPYSVTLDGTQTLFDGFSATDIFGTLFVSDVLKQGKHTVTVTNQLTDTTKPFLDLDFITWTSTVTDNGESKTLEDTTDAFAYSPATSWTTDLSGSQLTGFSSNNGHLTLTTGASVAVSFSGDFITVFGPVGPSIARYSVQVDGADAGTFNGTKEAYTAQVALYQATGLGAGHHTLELTSQPAVGGQLLAVDFVQVSPASTTAVGSGSGSSTGSSPTNTGSAVKNTSSSSIGPAVGGAIGGVIVLAVLIFLIFLFYRRKRRREQDSNYMLPLEDKYAPPAPTPYTMGSTMTVPLPDHALRHGKHHHAEPLFGARLAGAPSTGGAVLPSVGAAVAAAHEPVRGHGVAAAQPGVERRTRTPTHGGRTTRRTTDPSSSGRSRMSTSDGSSVGRSSTVHSSGAAGLGAGAGGVRRSKGGPLPLPPTANVPLPPDAPRMYVPGREQDMGPLPPDYQQATEAYNGAS
ncbi:hypothetical protein B0H14DRAFT_3502852 [Mycena olivaceomarginata]|nr:hypothetical protein B0H14DRAFT_3502852 [Mycena olivaceomarginata]